MASKNIKLPSKYEMNLYMKEGSSGKRINVVRIVVIILALSFLVFGVAGRYYQIHEQKAKVAQQEQELQQIEAALADYPNIKAEYDRYAKSYLTEQERALESREVIIDTLEAALPKSAVIESVSIVKNEAAVRIYAKDLDIVAKVRRNLESIDGVSNIKVYTADSGTDGTQATGVTASIVFNLGQVIIDEQEVSQ